MISLWSLLLIAHLLGLALAVGAATVKFTLLLKCNSNIAFTQHYMEVARPVTRLIILGLILLTLSGITWIALGFSLTPLLSVKVFLVAVVWILGPIIDNVVEPKLRRRIPPGRATHRGVQPGSEAVFGTRGDCDGSSLCHSHHGNGDLG